MVDPVAIAFGLERFRTCRDMHDAIGINLSFSDVSNVISGCLLAKYCISHDDLDWKSFCRNTNTAAVAYCLANPEFIVMEEFCKNVHPTAVKYCLDHAEQICFLSFFNNSHPDAVKYCIDRGYKDWGYWLNIALGCTSEVARELPASIFKLQCLMDLY